MRGKLSELLLFFLSLWLNYHTVIVFSLLLLFISFFKQGVLGARNSKLFQGMELLTTLNNCLKRFLSLWSNSPAVRAWQLVGGALAADWLPVWHQRSAWPRPTVGSDWVGVTLITPPFIRFSAVACSGCAASWAGKRRMLRKRLEKESSGHELGYDCHKTILHPK